MRFYPGPGLGGHCIPVDPLYLSWKLRTLKYEARFIELADEINTHMPHLVVEKTQDALNEQKKAINGSKILVLGIAYKKDIDDVRESPALGRDGPGVRQARREVSRSTTPLPRGCPWSG